MSKFSPKSYHLLSKSIECDCFFFLFPSFPASHVRLLTLNKNRCISLGDVTVLFVILNEDFKLPEGRAQNLLFNSLLLIQCI